MTHLVDHNSTLSSKTELNVFSVPTTQVAVKHGYTHDVHPQNTLTDSGPYEFHMPPDPHYLDLSRNHIYMKLSITKADGTALLWDGAAVHPEDKVGPINMIGKAFFKQVKLFLGSKLAYDSGDTYAYRAQIETELNYGENFKTSFLQAGGYEPDAPTDKTDAAENEGWGKRCQWFVSANGGGTVVEFMTPFHVDLFNQEKYLINNIDVRLELHRNSDAFALISHDAGANFKIRIHDMKWVVRKVDPVDSMILAVENALQRNTVKYPIRRVQIKTMQLEAGRKDTPSTTLFSGQIPRRLVVCCVDSDAFHGNYKKSPFNYKHYNAASIQITAGGVNYPPNPLEMDYDKNHYTRPFIQMYEALGLVSTQKSNWVDMADFKSGYCFYIFDLSPDSSDDAHWELIREGSTTVRLIFRDGIPAGGVKLIALAEFDNLVTIDRFRNVYFDYTP